MGVFYYDNLLSVYEKNHQWDCALEHLEELYKDSKREEILYDLIGFSWLYLVEGPILSKKYDRDPNVLALPLWGKYIVEGLVENRDDPFFNYITGYTLSLNGCYISLEYEQKGKLFLNNCMNLTKDPLLRQLAENYLINECSKRYVPIQNGKAICERFFDGDSLLDQHFNEIYNR